MGDNRTDSEDSRYFGPISGSLIVGKMAFEVWPISATVWLVVLSVVALIVSVLLVLALLEPRRSRPRRAAGRATRAPPPSVTG